MPQGTLTLKQQFQSISGTLGNAPISGGKLKGDEISFTAGGAQYTGHVTGSTMEGTTGGQKPVNWSAKKIG
jgi:hypothetical protein